MKIFLVVSVARQIDGEYVVVKAEKAFKESTKASEFANGLAKRYAETINTPSGPLQCVCERGVQEVDLEE
jgi:hypothetical protein